MNCHKGVEKEGDCVCNIGYFGEYCDKTVQGHPYWISARAIISLVSFSALCVIIASMTKCKRKDISVVYGRPRLAVNTLSIITALIVLIISAVDPLGIDGIIPQPLAFVMAGITLPLLSVILNIHLLNLVSVYFKALQKLHYYNEVSKINHAYGQTITNVPTVNEALSWNRRYFIICIVVSLSEMLLQIMFDLLLGFEKRARWLWALWTIILWIWYFTRVVVFLLFQSKILTIMPEDAIEHIKDVKLMRWLGLQHLANICSWIILTLTLNYVRNLFAFVTSLLLFGITVSVTVAASISPYLRVKKPIAIIVSIRASKDSTGTITL
jgi:uncharacterized membrane protein YhdT